MKVIILGAGISGITSAYYLSQAGHEVTVIDRTEGVAMETSFANAGQLSFAYTTPWASASIPMKALKWLFKNHSPLIIRPDGSLFQLKWLFQMLANCTDEAYAQNQSRMLRISEYSRSLFEQLEQQLQIQFEQRHQGTLHLFRHQDAFKKQLTQLGELDAYQIPYQILDGDGCLNYEPALQHIKSQIAGAIHLPHDKTGDCHIFAQQLAQICQTYHVKFKFNQNINRFELSQNNHTIKGIWIDEGLIEGDVFLCALGCFSRPLLQQLGLNIPIYPVKGYSLTIPITHADNAPQSTVLDETYKVALTRFDNRIRVGGMAELSGYQIKLPNSRRETLELVTNELFPNSGNLAQASFWSGLRPMTPDSTPIIGPTSFDNLFINAGHGTLGWTMSLGSAKIISDLIDKGTSEIKYHDLSLARYRFL